MREKDDLKFAIFARHGKPNVTPESPVYNRDKYMKSQDIVHLCEEGQKQIERIGMLIKEGGFKPIRIISSPEIRAQESAMILGQILGLDITIDDHLDDVDSPGGYLEGYKMKDLLRIEADSELIAKLRKKYPYETTPHFVKRMQTIFKREAKKLKIGETLIFLSHGDPISYFAYYLIYRKIPTPMELREKLYCPAGNAVVVGVDSKNKPVTIYFLGKVER
jgi:broad specificity phosphatase PhoE